MADRLSDPPFFARGQVSEVIRRSAGPRPGPKATEVTIVSAELQEWVFLDLTLVDRVPAVLPILQSLGEQRWDHDLAELRDELRSVLDAALKSDETAVVERAIELVDYGMASGTGVAVVPPSNST